MLNGLKLIKLKLLKQFKIGGLILSTRVAPHSVWQAHSVRSTGLALHNQSIKHYEKLEISTSPHWCRSTATFGHFTI